MSNDLNLLPPVLEIIERVKAVSGKEITFRPAPDQLVPATSKIARARMPQHIIKYQPKMVQRINHLTAHECGHILRTMEADPSIRVVPGSNAGTREVAVKELGNELSQLPQAMRNQMLDVWLGGLITQVTSLPTCVRIERWLHQEYPSLRDEQRLYLDEDVERTLQGLSKKVERMTPKTIFRISNSITYAYLRGLEPVTGKDLRKHFSGRPSIIATGIQLYDAFGEEDTGYSGDIRVTNEWARILKITDWFAWIGFENMPESYLKDV
ncbi:MAG TPA: hypothetical protein VFU31_10225 [Candidatus Binatia bacterium]|nr:hypothetical protein [Candidatus Binatia bacterium]